MKSHPKISDEADPPSAGGLDYPRTIDELFKGLRKRQRKTVVNLRAKTIPHLYPGLYTDANTLKLTCLIFPEVALTSLTSAELQHLHSELDSISGESSPEAAQRARKVLTKAQHFQEETAVLRQHGVLVPFEWEDGHAAMFQPQTITLGGQIIPLGETEMSEIANMIADEPSIKPLTPLHTAYGLSLLRENYPEDIAKHKLAAAIAVSEIVGAAELFNMTPITNKVKWSRAVQAALSARPLHKGPLRHSSMQALGMAVARHALPNVQFRSYHDVLEIRDLCSDELEAFWQYLRKQARTLRKVPADSLDAEIQKSAKRITHCLEDLERKLLDISKNRRNNIAFAALTTAPANWLSAAAIPLPPPLTGLLSTALTAWGIKRAAGAPADTRNGLTYLLKVRRQMPAFDM